MIASRIDVQMKLNRVNLGPLLVGSKNAGLRAWYRDGPCKVGVVGVQYVVAVVGQWRS